MKNAKAFFNWMRRTHSRIALPLQTSNAFRNCNIFNKTLEYTMPSSALDAGSLPPSSPLTLQLVQSAGELDSLAPQWDALLRQSATNSVFQSWRYLTVWREHFGDGGELAVLLARSEGELVGIAPLQIRRGPVGTRKHLQHLCFLGTLAAAEGLLFDFIVRRGWEQAVMGAFFQEASPLYQLGWDLLYLSCLPQGSPCLEALRQTESSLRGRLQETVEEDSPVIEFQPSWDGFLDTLPRKFRSELRRCLRGMEEKAGAHEFCAGGEMSLPHMHEQLAAFTAARWKDRRPEVTEEFLAFERDLLETFHREGLLFFYGWKTQDQVVALNCAFGHGEWLWGYQLSWNPDFAQVSPGHVSLASVVRHGIERGYRGLHMLLGGGAYKKAWAASSVGLCRLEAVHLRSFKGNLFDAAKRARNILGFSRGASEENQTPPNTGKAA